MPALAEHQQTGRLRADLIEKINRVVGVYTPVDVAENAPALPPKLPVMGECPEGMGELYVGDAGAYPLVRKGETIVFDPARREPTHGALCVMQRTNGIRDVMLTNRRTVGSRGKPYWWVNPVNRAANHEALERRHSSGPAGIIYASDGPFDTNRLRKKIVGTVVGVLVPSRRATEAWR